MEEKPGLLGPAEGNCQTNQQDRCANSGELDDSSTRNYRCLMWRQAAQQIIETSGAMGWELTAEQHKLIDEALRDRGLPVTHGAV